MLAIVAPGQGAQTPGFLNPWVESARVRDLLSWWSAVAEVDLIRLGTTADADEIKDTANAQPLIVAAGLVGALSLFPHPSDAFNKVGVTAGHSVGELTAAAGARAITAESAMVIVRERGKEMAKASALTPTGMSAILGGERTAVLSAISALGLTAANDNGAGQIVAAGDLKALAKLGDNPPDGARVRALSVAGAFHTSYMQPALDRLTMLSRSVTVRDPRTKLLSNKDGAVVHHGREVLDRIVGQISNPVRWDLCMETMVDLGVTAVIEVPPAGTLIGLIKRAMPGVETLALKTPEDIPAAMDLIARHGKPSSIDDQPTWRLVIAPFSGTFKVIESELGGNLKAGTVVGHVENRREKVDLIAEHGGTIIEFLAEDGDPVSPGQPLVRLHPNGQR
ncbi:MAG: acyltransferase domain-containing protein [Actinobacteria bacterium]|uniref:[acyl-carrier-protein] S-malonyltransferase n=2 Tax=freshwater metagenome TaxID=449393 RepID=A0A6J7UGG9_9ZZZZ|nr:acyltransferase domain-containing protein [Actinomycetota bacterium]